MDKKTIEENFYCAKSKGKVTRVINGIKMVPERKWVGLTDEERREIISDTERDDRGYVMALVEAKLKEKNG